MDLSNSTLVLEIFGGALIALYLLRRITLTILYCILVIKAAARAMRRQYRRAKIYWAHFKIHNPHGFLAKWAENICGAIALLIPNFMRRFLSILAKSYRGAENWFLQKSCPWVYRRLPSRAQNFCRWILDKIDNFSSRQALRRRRRYARMSYARFLARMEKSRDYQSAKSCPMRSLVPILPQDRCKPL